jgi:hypothetical protein
VEPEYPVTERTLRPEDVPIAEGDEHRPVLASGQVGQLDPNVVPPVAGSAVLVGGRPVLPSAGDQCGVNRLRIVGPNGEVDVLVAAGDGADVEVDAQPPKSQWSKPPESRREATSAKATSCRSANSDTGGSDDSTP